ncbi:unnamed protein product [Gulo gulo]|uniref:Uncharacterized protein n=1 Tax=Gulo gulo TaxID=48420 RepID=A0A9X9LR94_GULGU|nr:unnamed protein product [Gulo gulo]
MQHPIWKLGSRHNSVAVGLGQTSLSPSATWSLKMLGAITANRLAATHPQCHRSEHKPPRKQM